MSPIRPDPDPDPQYLFFWQATLSSGGVESSPPGLTSPPPPLLMEDIDPPAGLQFSMLQPTTDDGLGKESGLLSLQDD
jgi:hypothetical protein